MEKFDLESFPTSESAKKMLRYVSGGFYDDSYVGKWLFQVMGVEYDEALAIVMELPDQFFPETATWGLMYHEIKWGLPARPDLSYEERRGLICQRRDYRAPMTPYRMEELIKTVTSFQVHVADIHDNSLSVRSPLMDISHPNQFKIVLEGEGNADLKKIRELVDKVKQSHTVYDLLYLEQSHFGVPVRYAESVHFQTSFYPRYNLPQLKLSGKWKLNRDRKLSGYDSQETVDLYPVAVRFRAGAKAAVEEVSRIHLLTRAGIPEGIHGGTSLQVRTAADCQAVTSQKIRIQTKAGESTGERTQVCVQTEAREEARTRTEITGKSMAGHEAESKEQLRVRASAACTAGVGDITIYNKNRMSGGWKLNGSRKLNGGAEIR